MDYLTVCHQTDEATVIAILKGALSIIPMFKHSELSPTGI